MLTNGTNGALFVVLQQVCRLRIIVDNRDAMSIYYIVYFSTCCFDSRQCLFAANNTHATLDGFDECSMLIKLLGN